MVAGAGQRLEGRQRRQRHIHAESAGAVTPVCDAVEERFRQCAGRDQARIKQLRIDAGGDIGRTDRFAVVEDDAHGAIALHDHFAHPRVGLDLRAMGAGGRRHRLRDRAHAADGVAPQALPAVHLSEGVMQHHIGRTRRVGARIVADDGVEAEQRLDQIALEAIVEHVAGRAREQVEQRPLALQREAAQDVRAAERIERLADGMHAEAFDHIRRGAQHEFAQHVGDGFQLRVELVDPQGIAFAEFRDGLMGAAFAGQQIASIRRRQEVLRAALDDPQAVAMQVQIRDDLRIEQAHRVGGHRIAEAGIKLLRHRRAADHLAAIDHLHAHAAHREIGCAGQAVMARANDECVVVRHGPVIMVARVTCE